MTRIFLCLVILVLLPEHVFSQEIGVEWTDNIENSRENKLDYIFRVDDQFIYYSRYKSEIKTFTIVGTEYNRKKAPTFNSLCKYDRFSKKESLKPVVLEDPGLIILDIISVKDSIMIFFRKDDDENETITYSYVKTDLDFNLGKLTSFLTVKESVFPLYNDIHVSRDSSKIVLIGERYKWNNLKPGEKGPTRGKVDFKNVDIELIMVCLDPHGTKLWEKKVPVASGEVTAHFYPYTTVQNDGDVYVAYTQFKSIIEKPPLKFWRHFRTVRIPAASDIAEIKDHELGPDLYVKEDDLTISVSPVDDHVYVAGLYQQILSGEGTWNNKSIMTGMFIYEFHDDGTLTKKVIEPFSQEFLKSCNNNNMTYNYQGELRLGLGLNPAGLYFGNKGTVYFATNYLFSDFEGDCSYHNWVIGILTTEGIKYNTIPWNLSLQRSECNICKYDAAQGFIYGDDLYLAVNDNKTAATGKPVKIDLQKGACVVYTFNKENESKRKLLFDNSNYVFSPLNSINDQVVISKQIRKNISSVNSANSDLHYGILKIK